MQNLPRNILRSQCLHFRGLATVPNRQVRNPRQLFKPHTKEQKDTRPLRPPPPPIVPQGLQAELDKLLANLDQAHKRKSLLEAHSQWSSLQSQGLLPHVPNREFASLNVLLSTLTPALLSSSIAADPTTARLRLKALQDLRDLAVILAAQAGTTTHLVQLMELSLQEGRVEEVFDTWKKFETLIPPQPSGSNGEVQNQTEVTARRQLSRPVLQAYAAQQDYRSAITSVLRRRCFLSSKITDSAKSLASPADRFLQVVGAVIKIIRNGATRDVLEGFTRGNNPKFAMHFYETLLAPGQSPDTPWVLIAKERPTALDETDWSTRPLFHMGEPAFSMFVAEFARCNRVDLAQRVADDMTHLGFTVPDLILNILLDGYAKTRDFTAAGRIYAQLSEGGKTPDIFAHTTLINALFQQGAVDDAMALFRRAEKLFGGEGKDSLHVVTYNAVVHGLLINGRATDAEAIVDLMRKSTSGPQPDTVTYNTLLRHYGRKSDAANFVRILQNLAASGLEPDGYTYTTIVDTLLQSNRPDAVTRMLDVMERAKIPANTATYTAIIDCLIRRKGEKNVRAALQLVNKMEADGIPANEVTFTSLLAGVTRDDDLPAMVQKQLADEIMAKMTARGMEPNRITQNFLLLAALKTDNRTGVDQAMRIWREAIAEKGSPGHIPHTTYFILLNGLAKNERYDHLQEVLEYIFRSGWQPKGSLEKLIKQLSREIALRG
ncbi:hypothetical protein FRC01_002687 [Tulasnella sp. 417]|nr:hypothetical protein FRC01_002687 [Tulasnella sp. 417]